MSKQTIFGHRHWITDAFVNVIEEDIGKGPFSYYAHLSPDEGVTKACMATAKQEGRKPLYMIRVKMKDQFPIIGRKSTPGRPLPRA